MTSRDDILGRVRARLNRNADNAATGRAAIATALAQPGCGPRPVLPTEKSTLTARFIEKSLGQSSTVDRVGTLAEAPGAVARYLNSLGLSMQVVVWPRFGQLDWQGAGISAAPRGAQDADLVGITGCFCAIAETGTLMLCAATDAPATASLLPETHIAIVPASRVVAGMEEGWSLARKELKQLPRAVNFISGPSRTGDIEQTIVLGAHGPYRVHLILVENE